ncbi:MAG: HD domain-containing phosphohydrolase [Anaerolineaceae bacterium]
MSQPLRTLFVEDLPVDQELAERQLRAGGLQIISQRVETREDFLKALSEFNPDIILSDYSMPEFDGMQALKLAKELRPDIPFILLTGSLNEATAVMCMKAGASDYVIKGHMDRLPFSVTEAITKQQARNERRQSIIELRKSEVSLKKAQQVAHLGSWSWYIQEDRLEWSDEMYTIFGISQETFTGKLADVVVNAIHPDDRAAVDESNRLVIAENKPTPMEYRIIWPDGSVRVVYAEAGELSLDENGKPVVLTGIVQDITGRKQQEAEILRNNRELNLLYKAGKQISQTLDLQSIYYSFYKLVSSTMKCDTLYIAGFDRQTELITAKFAVSEGKSIDVSTFPAIPLEPEGRGIQSPVIRSGKPRIINDYQEALKKTNTNYYIDEDGKVTDEEALPEDKAVTQSSLVIPILLNDQVTGIIQIQSLEKEAYSPEDMKIAEALVSQIAVAENNAQLYQQSLKEIQARLQAESSLLIHAKRQETMASFGRALASTLDLMTIYQISERYLKEMIDCPNFGITYFDPKKSVITAAYFMTDGVVMDPASLPPLSYNPQETSSGRSKAIAEKTPVIVDDLASKRIKSGGILFGSDQEPETAIYVPILVEDEVMGLLDLQSYQKDAYSEKDGEWLSVVANQIGLAIQNARQFARSAKRISELSAMNVIDSAVTAHLEAKETYDILIGQVITQLKVDVAVLLLFDPETQEIYFGAEQGYLNKEIKNLHLKLGESLAGMVAAKKQLIHIEDLSEREKEFLVPISSTEKFEEYFGVPLLANDNLIGVLEVINRSPISADEDWLHFLNLLAGQAAVVLDALQLNKKIKQANIDLTLAYDATIEGWSQAMDLRDKETEGHTKRVTQLTLEISRVLGIAEDKLIQIRRGTLLHDIGKIGIPDQILLKPGPLTDEEWVIMKKHPVYAYEMLSPIEYLLPAINIPYCHHEKWDGSGYPRGLKGDQIPEEARIFALVDVFDALTSDRPYRAAWSKVKALEYMQSQIGIHFDPKIATTFLDWIKKSSLY